MKCWAAGSAAGVNTPAYLRDNIHVDLLARAYAGFVADIAGQRRDMRLGPIGYIETQGQFAGRFAGAMRNRLGLDCALSLAEQRDFAEPLARINTDRVDTAALGWDEGAAWDGIAAYYRGKIGR